MWLIFVKGAHQRKDKHFVSGRNRAKFFNNPLGNSTSKMVHVQLNQQSNENPSRINEKSTNATTNSQPKLRSISCQTIYREQSAQTKPYLPQIQYWPGFEKTELFQVNRTFDIDSSFGLAEIKAINRQRKRYECEQMMNEKSMEEKQQIAETLEWEEWLTREMDREDSQLIRFHIVEEMLKQRDKLYEIDSIKTIDYSINRLNNEHKRRIENIK